MNEPAQTSLVAELGAHSHGKAMTLAVRETALKAAAARDRRFLAPDSSTPLPESTALEPEQAETSCGNLLEIFEHGAKTPAQRNLVGTLLAIGVADELPSAPESELSLAAGLIWLAAHTPCNALEAIDETLGTKAAVLWQAVGRVARRPEIAGGDFEMAETLVAAAALAASECEQARQSASELARSDAPSLVKAMLKGPHERDGRLSGELTAAPHGPIVTTLLAVTGLLLVSSAWRAVARFALAYRRPASLKLSERGLELAHRAELLGRLLHDRETVVPIAGLARISREVRFARAGLYAGLLALFLGSYFGMGLLVDGLRVPGGSPSLIGMAMLVIGLGLVVDFALSALSDTARGRCRLVVVPHRGRAWCIGRLNTERADALLSELLQRLG